MGQIVLTPLSLKYIIVRAAQIKPPHTQAVGSNFVAAAELAWDMFSVLCLFSYFPVLPFFLPPSLHLTFQGVLAFSQTKSLHQNPKW